MLHLRLIVPPDMLDDVLGTLKRAPEVTNLWRLPGAAVQPPGDLVSCDVAREEGSSVLQDLRAIGLEEKGSIAVEKVDVSISRVASEAERAAPGLPVDAVVWEEVQDRVSESAVLSFSYLIFMTVATMIAAVGVITDSIVLIIGAMVVGPEFGPLAGVCVASVEGRPRLATRSLQALVVGFAVAITVVAAFTYGLMAVGVAPDDLVRVNERELTMFISQPNWFTVIVALLAGIVGMMALVSSKSGALVGVLISVTTVPAAADVGVAAAYGMWSEAAGAAAQLLINITAILASGMAVLSIGRALRRRRLERRTS